MEFNLDEIIENNKTKNKYVYKDTENLDYEFKYAGKYTYNIKLLYGEGLYRIMFFVNDNKHLLIMKQLIADKDKDFIYAKYDEIKKFFVSSSIKDLTEFFVLKNDNY